MLEKLMAFCLHNRLTVIIITLVLAALSIFGIMRTPVDVFPELYQDSKRKKEYSKE